MLFVTAVFLPLVIGYTSWVYRVLRGRVTLEHVRQTHSMY
jgi:cytochrome d ubiquinol oxidase subunit II